MIQNLLGRIIAILGAILAIFTVGNFLGKKSQKSAQLQQDFSDAIESKKRQEIRKSDDIATIRDRMRKYIRK
jgi:H+/gluconate symporter-like permease